MSKKPPPSKIIHKPRTLLDTTTTTAELVDLKPSLLPLFNEKEIASEINIASKNSKVYEDEINNSVLLNKVDIKNSTNEWVRISQLYLNVADIEINKDKKYSQPINNTCNKISNLLIIIYNYINELKPNIILWDLIYPMVKDKSVYNPAGKYIVKLFYENRWRKIIIDDKIPVNSDNISLLPISSIANDIWPLILSKALLKLFNGLQFNVLLAITALTGYLPIKDSVLSTKPTFAYFTIEEQTHYFSAKIEEFVNVSESKDSPIDENIASDMIAVAQNSSRKIESIYLLNMLTLEHSNQNMDYLLNINNIYSFQNPENITIYDEVVDLFNQPFTPLYSPYFYVSNASIHEKINIFIQPIDSINNEKDSNQEFSASIECMLSEDWTSQKHIKFLSKSSDDFLSFPIDFLKESSFYPGTLFRINVHTKLGYSLSLSGSSVSILEDKIAIPKLFKENFNLNVKDVEANFPNIAPNTFTVLLRQLFKVTEPTMLSFYLTISGLVASNTWIVLTNIDTSSSKVFYLLDSLPYLVKPNDDGYIVSILSTPKKSLPAGKLRIRFLSNIPITFTNELSAIISEFEDSFKANYNNVIFKESISSASPTFLTLISKIKFDNLDLFIPSPTATLTFSDEDSGQLLISITEPISACIVAPIVALRKGKKILVEYKFDLLSKEQSKILSTVKSWHVKIISGIAISLTKDATYENEVQNQKYLWESNQAGRSVKAKNSRDKFLSSNNAEFIIPEGVNEVVSEDILESIQAERLKLEEISISNHNLMVQRREEELALRLEAVKDILTSDIKISSAESEELRVYRQSLKEIETSFHKLRTVILITPPNKALILEDLESTKKLIASFETVPEINSEGNEKLVESPAVAENALIKFKIELNGYQLKLLSEASSIVEAIDNEEKERLAREATKLEETKNEVPPVHVKDVKEVKK